jgi:hypothetical protein
MTDITYGTLRKFLKGGYEAKTPEEIDGYILDKDISHSTAKVYHNAEKNETIINHRGSQGMVDWLYNAAYMYGGEDYYKLTPRYYEAKKAQEATEKKYGSENTITIGHSSGGLLSELLGKNSKQIITLNKAARPVFFPKIKHKNQLDIRSKCDIISAGGYYDKQIECSSADILAEHKTDILDRIGDKMVGEGSIFSRPNNRREFDESQVRGIINGWIRRVIEGEAVSTIIREERNRELARFIQTERGEEVLRNIFQQGLGGREWREIATALSNALIDVFPDEAPTDDDSVDADSVMEGEGSIFSRPNPARVEPVDDRREFDESQARSIINRWIAEIWNNLLETGVVRSEADDRLFRDFAYFIQTERGGEVLRNVFNPELPQEDGIEWIREARSALNVLSRTYPDDDSVMEGEGSIFSRPNPARVYVDDREFNERQARRIINRWIREARSGYTRSEALDRLFRDFAYFIQTDRGGEVLRNVFHPREGRESIIPSEEWRTEATTALNALLETYPDEAPTDDDSVDDDSVMEGTGKNNISRDSIEMNFSHLTPNALANMKHHIRPDGRRIDDSRFTIPDSRFFQERPRKRFMRGRGLVAESGMSGLGMGKNPAEPMIKNPQTQHAVQIPEKGINGKGLVAEGRGLVAEGSGEGMCGSGMCGTGKHKKGSAEMKEKMAKLRAMRKKK